MALRWLKECDILLEDWLSGNGIQDRYNYMLKREDEWRSRLIEKLK